MHAAVQRLQLQVVLCPGCGRSRGAWRPVAQPHVHHGPAIIGTPRPSGTSLSRSVRHAGNGVNQRLLQLRATSVAFRCWRDPGRLRRRDPPPCGTIHTVPFRKRTARPPRDHRPASTSYADAFNECTHVASDEVARPAKRMPAFRLVFRFESLLDLLHRTAPSSRLSTRAGPRSVPVARSP